MKEGGTKATNMTKTTEVLQEPDKSPSPFMSSCVRPSACTPLFDPEAAENQRLINAAFVSQAQGEIR
jgi:hypothetical protein